MTGIASAPPLPLDAEALVPHRAPMLLLDRLLSADESGCEAEAAISPDSPLADAEGRIEPAAFVELVAQAVAALKGYEDLTLDRPGRKGFLVGVKRFSPRASARAGERLTVRARTTAGFQGFSVAEGEVLRDGELLAEVELKLWVPDSDADSDGGAEP